METSNDTTDRIFLSVLEAQLELAVCFYASVLDVNCRHLSQILGPNGQNDPNFEI